MTQTKTAPTLPATFTALGLAAVGGVALGLLTLPLQGVLSRWGDLANSGAVWAVGAFVAGMLLRGRTALAAVAGAVVLVGAVMGYYTGADLFLPGPPTSSYAGRIIWSLAGLVAGPIFGVAGSWWRHEDCRRRFASPGLLGGVFVAEGLDRLITLQQVVPAIVGCSIGAVVPLLLGSTWRDRLWGLLAVVLFAAVGLVAFLLGGQLINWGFR